MVHDHQVTIKLLKDLPLGQGSRVFLTGSELLVAATTASALIVSGAAVKVAAP